MIKHHEEGVPIMSTLKTHYHFKLDLKKVEQHAGDNWLIHGTKHHKGNQSQSLELLCGIS